MWPFGRKAVDNTFQCDTREPERPHKYVWQTNNHMATEIRAGITATEIAVRYYDTIIRCGIVQLVPHPVPPASHMPLNPAHGYLTDGEAEVAHEAKGIAQKDTIGEPTISIARSMLSDIAPGGPWKIDIQRGVIQCSRTTPYEVMLTDVDHAVKIEFCIASMMPGFDVEARSTEAKAFTADELELLYDVGQLVIRKRQDRDNAFVRDELANTYCFARR